MMTMGSLFDGIGGFPLAAVHSGIVPLWASEIETFPMGIIPCVDFVMRGIAFFCKDKRQNRRKISGIYVPR